MALGYVLSSQTFASHPRLTFSHFSSSRCPIRQIHVACNPADHSISSDRRRKTTDDLRVQNANTENSGGEKYGLKEDQLKLKIPSLRALHGFTRPYVAKGIVIGVASSSLIAIENISDISLPFFIGVLKAMACFLCMIVYSNGINQVYDIEIDKINKPFLPLVSGEMTLGTGIAISSACGLMAASIAYISGSKHLIWGTLLSLFIFSAYSINMPLLRWKNTTIGATFSVVSVFAIIIQLSTFLHIQTKVLGRQVNISQTLIFGLTNICIFYLVLSFFKDIPDIEGDRKYETNSLAVQLGSKKVFWICIYILEILFALAVIVGSTSSHLWSKLITIPGHAILALILWKKAKSVDLSNKHKIQSFYMVLWKMLYVEHLLVPLVR